MLKAQHDEEIKNRDAWRALVMDTLKDLQETVKPLNEINTSYRRGKWIIGITTVAVIGAFVTAFIRWFGNHWN
jgi:hypothetical protein